MLKVGDKAPDFALMSEGEQKVSLSQFSGNRIVLYFYPKDHTEGCTQQACDFRNAFTDLLSRNIIVIGISRDSLESHQKFKQDHGLPFLLLSDPDAEVSRQYDVFVQKKMYGKSSWGIERTTFLLDESGHLLHIWPKVKVQDHVMDILSFLDELDRRHLIQGAGL